MKYQYTPGLAESGGFLKVSVLSVAATMGAHTKRAAVYTNVEKRKK
jgi:hypothetical protein